jgi:diguanylate cyclase (GGDEF)-like protein
VPTDAWTSVGRAVERASEAGLARSQRAQEELAKSWLLEILERTPLAEIEDVPIGWIVREAPALIADIVGGVSDPSSPRELELPAEGLQRIGALGHLRRGDDAPALIPRDLAALQTILIEALRRDVPERQVGSFASSVERLAEIFGGIQATVNEELVNERAGEAPPDELTGLQGEVHMREWLRILLAEYRRYGHPFSVLMIDIEGMARINDAHGRGAGDRMITAVAAIVRRQVRMVDRAFRLTDDEFCVLAPHQQAEAMLPMAERLCEVVDRAQGPESPRIAIAAGIATCPDHGDDADALLSAAEEATWAAKAAGRGVAIGELHS